MNLRNGLMDRGAGFCLNIECEDYIKGVFILNHKQPVYRCPKCRKLGRKVIEDGETLTEGLNFFQVRVEFDYNAVEDKFKQLAIVTDTSAPQDGNVYTLKTPLIRKEDRALQTAENLLGNLMRADESIFIEGFVPRDMPNNLDFDKPLVEVKARLEEIYDILSNSRLRNLKGE